MEGISDVVIGGSLGNDCSSYMTRVLLKCSKGILWEIVDPFQCCRHILGYFYTDALCIIYTLIAI